MKIPLAVLLSLVLSISLSSAYGSAISPVTITADQTHYSEGDTILLNGDVSEILFGYEVSLMILAPNGNVVYIEKFPVDSNKKFQTELLADGSLMTSSGIYSVLAMYEPENGTIKTSFNFEKSTQQLNTVEPLQNILLNFDFVNSNNKIQEHIDYKIIVTKNGEVVYASKTSNHSTTGSVSLPLMIEEYKPYGVLIEVNGIMFNTIPSESASFSIMTNSENTISQKIDNSSLKINLAVNREPSPETHIIPSWIKNNAAWWAHGQIDDAAFTNGIQYLLEEKILDIPDLPYPASWSEKKVPEWVKNNASWWADDLIEEEDFIKGIKFLVEKGVIEVYPI